MIPLHGLSILGNNKQICWLCVVFVIDKANIYPSIVMYVFVCSLMYVSPFQNSCAVSTHLMSTAAGALITMAVGKIEKAVSISLKLIYLYNSFKSLND